MVVGARRATGRLLLVDGDPGIGKTRLVGDLARTVEADGALVLWGRCDEEPVAPFQPFAEALGRYFHVAVGRRISRMPELAAGRAVPPRPPPARVRAAFEQERGDPESNRFRFFEAVTATLNELSASGTVLLVVDDLHWADQPTLLLLRHVLRNIDTGQARHHRDVHRHRGAVGRTGLRSGAGRLPGRTIGRDGAPAGAERGRASRSWREAGRRPGRPRARSCAG